MSFQASLDAFEVILNKWMHNPSFPTDGIGHDQLFAEGFATIQKAGFYFVPPRDSRFIGAGIFDTPRPTGKPRKPGSIIIRKRAVDVSGNPALAEIGGIGFQIFRADTNEPIGGAFFTDSAGHAESPDVPLRTPLILREISTPGHLEPISETAVELTRRRTIISLVNRVRQPGYGG